MTDAMQALLDLGVVQSNALPANSRYQSVGTAVHQTADGRPIVHLRRRFIPQPEALETWRSHHVVRGDRLDTIAALHLGDPLLYWRICDANRAMRPDDLVETPGVTLRIALDEASSGV